MPQVLVNGYITRDMIHCQLFIQLSYVVGNHRVIDSLKKRKSLQKFTYFWTILNRPELLEKHS